MQNKQKLASRFVHSKMKLNFGFFFLCIEKEGEINDTCIIRVRKCLFNFFSLSRRQEIPHTIKTTATIS